MRFGRYELGRKIGEGGMSEVFLASPVGGGSDGPIVIKRMRPTLADDERFVSLFEEEFKIAARMDHPNVVKVFEAGEVYGQLFIAMEYVDGVDCWRLVNGCVAAGAPPTARVACFVVRQALLGLAHVHGARDEAGAAMGVVHGDVSPTNIYVSRRGDVKLGDFGIARRKHRELSTRRNQLTGKVAYMAPEQVLGLPFDHHADLFAAGTVLTELLIHDRLFATKSHLTTLLAIRDVRLEAIEPHRHKLPEGIEAYILKALAREAADRFDSAGAMAEALGPFLEGADEAALRAELSGLVETAAGPAEDPAAVSTRPQPARRRPTPPTPLRARAGRELRPSEQPTEVGAVPLGRAAAHSPSGSIDVELDFDIDVLRETPSLPMPAIGDLDAVGMHTPTTPVGPIAQVTFRCIDGRMLGPMHFPAALDKVMDGAVEPFDEVSVDGSPFCPLAEVEELARFAPAPTPTTGQVDAVPPPDRRALLGDESVSRLVATIGRDRETGMAVFEHGPIRKDIYFEQGNPIHVSSNMASELLGEHLVRAGVISRMELEMAFALLPKFDNHLGDTLVGLGLVDSVTLFRHISDQVRGKLLDLFSWTKGEFRYYRGVQCPQPTFPLGIQALAILWEGLAKSWDDEVAEAWYRDHGGETVRAGARPVVEHAQLLLPERVADAFPLRGLPARAGQVAERLTTDSGLTRAEALLAIRLAAELGIVDLGRG